MTKWLPGLGLLAMVLAMQTASACEGGSRLGDSVTVPGCDAAGQRCVPATRAVYEYSEAFPDSDADIVIVVPASPWHFYDGEERILSVEEVASVIRGHMTDKTRRVVLVGSWTGGTPDAQGDSLAQQVSAALDGFPVEGMDGFLWLDAKGGHRVTRQAFTLRAGSGYYQIAEGSEVFVSLSHGWAAGLEQQMIANGDTRLLRTAAVGWEVFMLCPERALSGFELAARHGDAIAAYNAAVLRLERDDEGDRAAAISLLQQAADSGDSKAAEKLLTLRRGSER